MHYTRQHLKAYFEAILPFCNKRKVQKLLTKCGIDGDVNADNCVLAYETKFNTFCKPFGAIAQNAIASPKYQAYMQVLSEDMKANGNYSTKKASALQSALGKLHINKANNSLSAQDKFIVAQYAVDTITGWLNTGANLYSQSINKDTNRLIAESQLYQSQAAAEEARDKSRLIWIIPVCVIVLLVIMIPFLVVGRSRS